MKSNDLMVLGVAAALAVGLVWYAKRGTATPSGSLPQRWADANYWPGVPYNYETTIPMQPGGGY